MLDFISHVADFIIIIVALWSIREGYRKQKLLHEIKKHGDASTNSRQSDLRH